MAIPYEVGFCHQKKEISLVQQQFQNFLSERKQCMSLNELHSDTDNDLISNRLSNLLSREDLCNVEDLQQLLNNGLLRKGIRKRGIGSIFWGVIAIVMGFSSMDANAINAVLGIIGICLLVEGFWLFLSRAKLALFIDGIALATLGIWNISISVHEILMIERYSGDTHPPDSVIRATIIFLMIGISQIYWGVNSFRRYFRISKMPAGVELDQSDIKMVDDLVRDIIDAESEAYSDIIEFDVNGKTCEGCLANGFGVFVIDQDVICADQSRIVIKHQGNFKTPDTFEATISLSNRNFNSVISVDNFKKYQEWQLELNPSQVQADLTDLTEQIEDSWFVSRAAIYSLVFAILYPVGLILAVVALINIRRSGGRLR
ncbi:MAG: hypothetical protein KAS23_11665, partial [Anaerohalosphaera sp.]|nr:hypothetical protein [Anaerohalosphaera sp.]